VELLQAITGGGLATW